MIPPGGIYPDPPPMPDVRRSIGHIPDAIAALERAQKAWNKTQLIDALDSAAMFIREAQAIIKGRG